jgi:uncharacterized protein
MSGSTLSAGDFDHNSNMGEMFGQARITVIARQAVFHDAAHPSHILLPVIPRL